MTLGGTLRAGDHLMLMSASTTGHTIWSAPPGVLDDVLVIDVRPGGTPQLKAAGAVVVLALPAARAADYAAIVARGPISVMRKDAPTPRPDAVSTSGPVTKSPADGDTPGTKGLPRR